MTLDAVGGVWRYSLDLARGLQANSCTTVFAGFGPAPSAEQFREANEIGTTFWCDAPLDWMAGDEAELSSVPFFIRDIALRERTDLIHLNLPSQAAELEVTLPVLVVSHSCVATWFKAVRRHAVPEQWAWQTRLNRNGFKRAQSVLCPSHSHAAALAEVYGKIDGLAVIHNGSDVDDSHARKRDFAFAAGRWWDDGKNGAILNAVASKLDWPLILAGSNRGPNGEFLALEHVQHLGELPHAEAMTLMREAAIVVSPSIYEPFGLAALEAARTASALVLSDIPVYRELWDGAALFASPHDPDSFAGAINRLTRDRALRMEMGQRAQARSARFTIKAQSRCVSRLYTRLLSSEQTVAEGVQP